MENKKEVWPNGSYCNIRTRVVHIPGPSQEEIEKIARKYSSSPKKTFVKVKLHG